MITDYRLHRLHVPLDRPIGDSQVRFVDHWIAALELITDTGLVGVGFELRQGLPLPDLATLRAQFEHGTWPALKSANPYSVGLKISRPRGGNVGASVLGLAVETATWDLMARQAEVPLYRFLGGNEPKVPAYGSTLDFHLSDNDFRTFLASFAERGFRGIKVKIGHPDLGWDLRRLAIVHEVFGTKVDLMVDSNEAWSPREATLRLRAYRDAGFEIYWIEDPITRDDYRGYSELRAALPFTRINTGEYLDHDGKCRLLENGAVDVLNVHGHISDSRAAARLAAHHGVPVSLGTTILELGVHLAASFPECLYLEFADLAWNRLVKEPVAFEDGYAIAPDRPGHGIELDPEAISKYRCS